jgi:predicted nucleotidyltransferase
METRTLTLAERDAVRMERRRAAVADLSALLAQYARTHSGRYILYGSTARGEDRATSDVDILVDFPPARRIEAAVTAEAACAELDLRADVRDVETASDSLRQRIAHEGRVLA